jgi:CheY-like chemotaxis protein
MTQRSPGAGTTGGKTVYARVLVVDDQARMRESLAYSLREEIVVDTAGSMQEAMDRLRSGARFDMILSDVRMPGGSGVDLHESIEREFPMYTPRIVFMTGGLTEPLRGRLQRLPNVCLEKPIDLGDLRALIRLSVDPDAADRSR